MLTEKQAAEIIRRRIEIASKYCQEKGWPTNPADLSFEQILEIRDLKEWQDPLNPQTKQHETGNG